MTVTCNERTQQTYIDSEEDDIPEEIVKEVDNRLKSNLDETEVVNLGDAENIWMDKEDDEKMAFITLWGMYCYKMMPFGLNNAGATYMRAMTTIFHDMMHKEIECTFGVPAGKLLGFIVSHRGIELDPSKVKAIRELPPPRSKKDVMSFLGRLNYISRFVAQSIVIYEPIFKMLKKDAATKWTDDYQKTFDRIKEMDPLKYIFQKHMPTGKLDKWQILLSEFDIVYVTQKAIKGQALVDHVAENPLDGEYELLKTYFPNEEVSFIGEDIAESYDGWRIFFDGVENFKGVGIGAVLVSETGQHYPMSAKLRFLCTNNMAEYEACILGLNMSIDMNIQELLVIGDSDLLIHQHVPRIQNEFADALATLSPMIQHPDKNFIDSIPVKIHDQPAYYAYIEEEANGKPWFHDIKEYLEKGEYPRVYKPYSETHTSEVVQ
ncbi:uncharacterized protein [Nicotiana sylvestris]|uniref:uncharacterized protein n=1 Tax=Nicotiana sylvestris TaxID=4096 RepID=UPI00388CD032